MKKILLVLLLGISFLHAEIKFVFLDNVHDYDPQTKSYSSVCVQTYYGECSKTESIDTYLSQTVCENRKFDIKGFSAQYIEVDSQQRYRSTEFLNINTKTYARTVYKPIFKSQLMIELVVDCLGKKKEKSKIKEENILKIKDNTLDLKVENPLLELDSK